MNRFAELLDRLSYEPGRNNKLRLMTDYFRHTPDPDRGYALAALTGALVVSIRQAEHAAHLDRRAHRPGAVRALARLCRRHLGDDRADVAGAAARTPPPRSGGEATAPPSLAQVVTTLDTLGKAQLPGADRALARCTRRDRPLGIAQGRDGRAADRRVRAACQDGRRRARRQGRDRDRTDLERSCAALHGAVRLARGPRRQAGA